MTDEETDGSEGFPEELDERPQRRREWSGPLRSIVLPILAVAAIVGVVWLVERGGGGSGGAESDGTGVVARPGGASGPPVGPRTGNLAPDFLLTTLDGGQLRLSDLAGRPVFLNFWASWCGPCRKEMPELVAESQRRRGSDLAIIGVNVQENANLARGFVEEFGMDFATVLDMRGQVAAAYRVSGLPSSVFIDRNGVIRGIFFGPLTPDELQGQLGRIS
ncbi:MAG: TlpA family protein disulfide reductase [Dehalococcoidia bacterium]|nr:TlpA family protein disulfide reductase [Dehalococcoidia bacterium]